MSDPPRRSSLPITLALAAFLGSCCVFMSRVGLAQPPAARPDPRELEAFVDGVMDTQRLAFPYVGAVVVVVRDGEVLLSKGYGYSDLVARTPVDPGQTVFRIASNSKMFVWVAVMQLVEQGRLDLHTDVNQYLSTVRIPPTFRGPITLEHLMTHTAGFEDRVIGVFSEFPESMRPLSELLARDMPERIFPAGSVPAYSNYGAALAALVVEEVSGIPFDTYVRERILAPLQMTRTTLLQPVPSELAGDLSKGYRLTAAGLEEAPFEFVPWAPAGGMSGTAEDMGRFMIALLDEVPDADRQILRPETIRRMRTRLTSFSPKLDGMAHGFMEMNGFGETVLSAWGALPTFYSLTAMVPSRGLGVFVAYNTAGTDLAREAFLQAFLGRILSPPEPRPPEPPNPGGAELARFAGTYFPSLASRSDLTAIRQLILALPAGVGADGELTTIDARGRSRWRAVEPLVFSEVDGPRRLVFREDEAGRIADACMEGIPGCATVFLKQPWWNSQSVQWIWAGLPLGILLAGFFGFPFAGLLQWKEPMPPMSSLARLTAWLTSLLFLGGLVFTIVAIRDPSALAFGVPASLEAALALWVAGAIIALASIPLTVTAWMQGRGSRLGRLSVTLVCLAGLAFAGWLHHWNLLGWHY